MFLKTSFISPFRWRQLKRKAVGGDCRGDLRDIFHDEIDCRGERDEFSIIQYRWEAQRNSSHIHNVDFDEVAMKQEAIRNFKEGYGMLFSSFSALSFRELKFPSIQTQCLDARLKTNVWTMSSSSITASMSTVLRIKYEKTQ